MLSLTRTFLESWMPHAFFCVYPHPAFSASLRNTSYKVWLCLILLFQGCLHGLFLAGSCWMVLCISQKFPKNHIRILETYSAWIRKWNKSYFSHSVSSHLLNSFVVMFSAVMNCRSCPWSSVTFSDSLLTYLLCQINCSLMHKASL